MKKSMNDGLLFKQQVNEFMTKALHGANIPSRQDTDSILDVLRSMEERVLSSVEEVTKRVMTLEQRVAAVETAKGSSKGSRKGTST